MMINNDKLKNSIIMNLFIICVSFYYIIFYFLLRSENVYYFIDTVTKLFPLKYSFFIILYLNLHQIS